VKFPTRLRVAVAVILLAIVLVALAVYFSTPPTPSPTPEMTPTIPTPTPIPHPAPPPPKLNITANFASSEGFNLTKIESQGSLFPFPILVLRPGGSGSIPITLISTGDEDYTVSLLVSLAGENPKFEGVRCTLSQTTLSVKAGTKVSSILSIEVDSDAPTALYCPSVDAHVEGFVSMPTAPLFLLVYPHTPSYAFRVYVPTPGAPTPLPPPGITPTPTETPIPDITAEPGGTEYIMFYIDKGTDDPTVQVKLNLTHDSGPLPSGIRTEVVFNPLEVVPAPTYDSVIMLTLTAAADVPEGTYRMIATITVGSYTVQISFDLTATSQKQIQTILDEFRLTIV